MFAYGCFGEPSPERRRGETLADDQAMLTIKEENRQEIERIISQMECAKDFICYKSGFQILCKAIDAGLESFLRCLEPNPFVCAFSLHFGSEDYCKCPLRVYIGKNLEA